MNFRIWPLAASIAAALAVIAAPARAQTVEVPGVGWEGQGADLAVVNLDPGGADLILMAYDNPAGGNTFRYRVGKNLNSNGVASSWSAPIIVPGLGWEGQGAGLGIAYLDNNARPEAIFMAYDSPTGPNNIRYTIGWNLNANGIAASWTVAPQVPGMGWEGQGAGVAVGRINAGANFVRPDMVVGVYDNPTGGNNFRYKIGWDLGMNGVPAGWSSTIIVPGLGWEGQGAGAALANLDANPRPELVLMAYDAPAGANNFRYKIGWNLNTAGVATSWGVFPQLPGLGWEGQGAGLAITCLDSATNARTDWIFMAYDNPAGANSFRYRVVKNQFAPTCAIP